MIDPKDEIKALEKWALDELRQVSRRAFEFAKFFFAISAGSFGIIPFFEKSFSITNIFQLIGISFVSVSAVLAIRMIEPPSFVIADETNLSGEHAKFAERIKGLRYKWLFFWLIGIISLVIGLTSDIELRFVIGTE